MTARLSLLGRALLGTDAGAAPLPADRRGCLLALLATDGGWVDRERLALLFWPESDESSAKAALRQLLVRTRRLSLDPPLEATVDVLRWSIDCDVAEFRQALGDGDAVRAVDLYGGPFLDGFTAHDVGSVDAWIEAERDRLHAAFHGAGMRVAASAMADGRPSAAAELLSRLLALEPLAEDVLAAQVRALYLGGRREAALQTYARFAAELDVELGLEPLESTRALATAVRRGDAVVVPGAPTRAAAASAPRALRASRLVSRDAERHALRSAVTPAAVLAGEPGIGKTALLRELHADAPWCGGVEGLERLPYHPLAELVRARTEAAAGLGAYLEDLARLVPEVAPGLEPAPLDPAAARGRLAEAIARFVAAVGAPLVVDDLQWVDPATLETLGYLVRRGQRVVGAYRAGEAGPELLETLRAWRAAGVLTEVEVGPIPAVGIQALIADLMGRDEGPPTFARHLHGRSGGNPLFALETLESLFEAGVLRADDQGWHTDVDDVTRDYSELDVPRAVSQVIARRLAHLDDRTLRVLEALAVAQDDAQPQLLARATGLSVGAVADALDEAAATGFLDDGGEGPRHRAGTFRHDLLRQCVDERLPPARRRLLHGLLAEALEGAGSTDPGRLAEHWWRAGQPSRARAAWLAQAAMLRARGLQADAIVALDAARTRLPAGADRDALQVVRALATLESGRPDEAEGHLDEVADAPSSAERPLDLRLKALLARVAVHFHRGKVADAQALLDEARGWAERVDDADLAFEYVLQRARAAKEAMRFDEAIALMEPAVARLRERRADLRLVQFMSSLATLYDDTDRAEQAMPLHREALGLAKALGTRYFQVEASINLLFCTAALGRYDEAADWAEEALTLGDYDNVPVLRTNLAANYFEAGRYADALGHYALLSDLDAQPHLQVIALARCAECCSLLERPDEVGGLLDRALERLPRTDVAVAQGAAAIALLRFGDDAQVRRLYAQLPDLESARLPPHQRERYEAALAARA